MPQTLLHQVPLDKKFGIGIDVRIVARVVECLNACHHIFDIGQGFFCPRADDLFQLRIDLMRQIEPQTQRLAVMQPQRKVLSLVGHPQFRG